MTKEQAMGAYELRSLRQDELEAWYAFCAKQFAPVSADYFRAHFENDPDRSVENIFVALRDGEIVSSVRLFTRSVYVNGRNARVGGIGEVCTDPSARGNGLSTRLLTRAMDTADARGYELGMLYGVLQSHYGRQGFENAPGSYKRVNVTAPDAAAGQVRPFERADLDAVMGLHDLYSSQFDFAYRRTTREYWEKWVLHEWRKPLVLVRDERICAYADVQAHEGALRVREVGALPGEDAALWALLCAAAQQNACTCVVLPMPVLKNLQGERDDEAAVSLMVRMQKSALGFASRKEMLDSVRDNIVQWDTDDY